MTEIHQMIAGAATGDAITNYALEIKEIMLASGVKSEIIAPYQHTAPQLREKIRPATDDLSFLNKDTTVIYHFSIGSEMTEHFTRTSARKVMCYHNITPEKYLRSINDQKARVLYEGREELKRLKHVPDIALAVSGFNAAELERIGYTDPQVIPLTLNQDYLKTKPSRSIIRSYKDNFVNFLFVGRISPNKRLEDVLKVFYYYNKTINPNSRLIFAGAYVGMEKYYTYLRSFASEMNLQNVMFTGHISLEELLGYYAASSLFLCMSEHEGVCIPLIESMYFQKPVFALAHAAIPETLNGTGVLLHQKDYRSIAELIHIVIHDKHILHDIIEKQNQRINDFSKDKLKNKLQAILEF